MPIDYKDYPKNWKTEIRPRILKRANNCCEFCNVPNYKLILRGEYNGIAVYQDDDGNIYDASNSERVGDDYVGEVDPAMKNKFIKVILTIAHLDHDVHNHNVKDERLRALCQRCHLNYDRKSNNFKKAKRKYKNSLFPIS